MSTLNNILFACCDGHYYQKFAQQLISSVHQSGNRIIIQIVNPLVDQPKITSASSHTILSWHDNKTREFYACARFLFAPEVFKLWPQIDGILMIDTDCLVRKEVRYPSSFDYALFHRDPLPNTNTWETEGSRVAAGAVYIKKSGIKFLLEVKTQLEKTITQDQKPPWFIDQYILYQTHLKWKDYLSSGQIDKKLIDWEFNDDSIIWTGKGSRKYNNETYLNEFKKHTSSISEP